MNIIPIILLVIGISIRTSANPNIVNLCNDKNDTINLSKGEERIFNWTECSTAFHALVIIMRPVPCTCTDQCKCSVILLDGNDKTDYSVCNNEPPKCYIIKNREEPTDNLKECHQNEIIVLGFSYIGVTFGCNDTGLSNITLNYTHIHTPPATTVSPTTTTHEISGELLTTTTTASSTNRTVAAQKTTGETESSTTTKTQEINTTTTFSSTTKPVTTQISTRKTELSTTTAERAHSTTSSTMTTVPQVADKHNATTLGISISLGILLFIALVVGTVFLVRYRRRRASLGKPMPSTGRGDSYNAGDEMPMNQVYETIPDNKTEREEVINQLYGTR